MAAELSRRNFLKAVAITGAAAAGCGEVPSRQLMPYVVPDENVIPGVPTFYATACRECPAACGVVARVREGRVVKLEGNPRDPIGAGALCARGQAALQGLYNPDRLAGPRRRMPSGALAPIDWDTALFTLRAALEQAAAAGRDRVAFLGMPGGPTLDAIVPRWLAAFGSTRWVLHEPLDEEPARAAAARCFGRRELPVYHLDTADVLVSFGADFLETWRSPVEYARQYAAFRAPRGQGGRATLGWSAYVGPRQGLTAAKCDEWLAPHPGTEPSLALALLAVLAREGRVRGGVDPTALARFAAGYEPEAVAARTGIHPERIRRLARRLADAEAPVVLAGSTDPALHTAAFILTAAGGGLGRTLTFHGEAPPPPAASRDVAALAEAMRRDAIDVLVVAGPNPLFTLPAALGFADALRHVRLVVWCGGVPDETAEAAHLLLPIHHPLESWGDFAPRPGVTLLAQPVMQPVFDSRPLGDVLLASAPLPWRDTAAAVEATWRTLHETHGLPGPFAAFWEEALRTGGWFREPPAVPIALRPEVLTERLDTGPAPAGFVLVAFPHLFLYDGRGADKPWLQETPEPVAQIAWGSWVEIHPETARSLGFGEGDRVRLHTGHGSIEGPVHLSPGLHPSVLAVPLGQGHTAYGRYATDRGDNPWRVLPPGAGAVRVTVERGARRALPVSPVGLSSMLGRPIVEAMSLAELRRGERPPPAGPPIPEPFAIRPEHVYPEHQWGMTIDLNACTGCSACVTACYAENNIPVVGPEEVARGHVMSWIRIERFWPDGPDAPPLYLAPMLCQQCDHAPCEPVCPVFASFHTEEGLNGQVYNRCIGTRYCNNNCPYKVRRFNWFKPEWPAPLHLQLNPDVTVRGAGVMEKCTFCVQRIRAAEMDARAEHRPVRDGEIVPACAQTCPTRAITFGDMKDTGSAMMRRRSEERLRTYRALEELGTEPAIVYLRAVYRPREVV
jgi:molybdopterin-containing oxidoreductase family iron-sulfur binding subunit